MLFCWGALTFLASAAFVIEVSVAGPSMHVVERK